ncbi:MAG: serine hydrolase [Flavobacteriia bacterium]|nr:MAG: serine hydrolase [Flavobacteriia bacterium]
MKKTLWFLPVLVLILGFVIVKQYPRLNIVSGYAAKNMCSCMFEAGRTEQSVIDEDNNFSPINKVKYNIDTTRRIVEASVFGLMKRKAVFYDNVGCQLVQKGETPKIIVDHPVSNNCPLATYYPYGLEDHKDTLFSNINYNKLDKAVRLAFDKPDRDSLMTRALIVLYKDHIIAEKYDEGFDKNTKILGWSMSKSILITLFGILEKQGRLNEDDTDLFPEWANDERKNISIKNLMQMSSGLEWNEDYKHISDVTTMLFLENDMGRVQLEKPLAYPVGSHWNYSSGTTNLLSLLLRNKFLTHQDYLDFPVKQLYDKLGMKSALMETDPSGTYVFSSYGWATPRDWGKLGLLYLHNGEWNGEQIINKHWVDYVTTPCEHSNGEYGAHLWLNAGGKYPDCPRDMYMMVGHQGQRVYVLPSQDMVIVRMGLNETTEFDYNTMVSNIIGSIEH